MADSEPKIIRKCDDKEFQPSIDAQYRYFTLPIEQIPNYNKEEIQVLHHGLDAEKAGLFWKCTIPPMCSGTAGEEALKAKYICENAKDDSSTEGKDEASASIQVLVNKGGCAYWFPLQEKILIEDLKLNTEGKALEWKEKKIFIIVATEDRVDKNIEVTECPTSTPSPG